MTIAIGLMCLQSPDRPKWVDAVVSVIIAAIAVVPIALGTYQARQQQKRDDDAADENEEDDGEQQDRGERQEDGKGGKKSQGRPEDETRTEENPIGAPA